jgi:hypothetical protein
MPDRQMRPVADSTTDALLLDIRDRVARLEVRVERIERRLARRRGRDDDRWDEALMVAIVTSTDGRRFSTRELFTHATVDATLKRALDDACIENPRQCGKWLRRHEGHAVAGIVIECVDVDHRDGLVWQARVSRV